MESNTNSSSFICVLFSNSCFEIPVIFLKPYSDISFILLNNSISQYLSEVPLSKKSLSFILKLYIVFKILFN